MVRERLGAPGAADAGGRPRATSCSAREDRGSAGRWSASGRAGRSRLLARTWRIEHGARGALAADVPGPAGPTCSCCWHEALLPLLWHHRGQGVAIVVSEARDGQYLADFAPSLGYRPVRGSSTAGRGAGAARGGAGAPGEACRRGITPDGPRGPRREIKPGGLAAAARGARVICRCTPRPDRAWRLDSWDRFLVPKPFARVRMVYGQPFEVARG